MSAAPNSTSEPVSKNIVWHEGVTQTQREELVGQKGVTIWFTGLSGAFLLLLAPSSAPGRCLAPPSSSI